MWSHYHFFLCDQIHCLEFILFIWLDCSSRVSAEAFNGGVTGCSKPQTENIAFVAKNDAHQMLSNLWPMVYRMYWLIKVWVFNLNQFSVSSWCPHWLWIPAVKRSNDCPRNTSEKVLTALGHLSEPGFGSEYQGVPYNQVQIQTTNDIAGMDAQEVPIHAALD